MPDIFEPDAQAEVSPDVSPDISDASDSMMLTQCQTFLDPNEYFNNLKPAIRDRILAIIGEENIHVVLQNGPACGRKVTLPSPLCNGEIPLSPAFIDFKGDILVMNGAGYSLVGEEGYLFYRDVQNSCGEFTKEPISAMGVQFKPLKNFSESEIQAIIEKRDFDQIVIKLTAYKGEHQINITGEEITHFLKAGETMEIDAKTMEIVEFFSGVTEADIISIVEEAEAAENSQYQGTGCNTTDPGKPAKNFSEIMHDPLSVTILCMFVWKIARLSARIRLNKILNLLAGTGKGSK